jgi:lauroyl/myristoyl acyltransferase
MGRKKRPSFRRVKDLIALPGHAFVKSSAYLPAFARSMLFGGLGCAMKASYFVPANHMRHVAKNICTLAGRDDPFRLHCQLMSGLTRVVPMFGQLLRHGPESIGHLIELDPDTQAKVDAARRDHGGLIVIVPHCVGSVIAAARVGQVMPTVIMTRTSKSPKRRALLEQYLELLGPKLVDARSLHPSIVARRILEALGHNKLIIGTTDLVRKKEDCVEVTIFGQKAWMPDWPARFSSRRKKPILPAYIHSKDGKFVLTSGEPYIADKDLAASTQPWADYFESAIKRWPEDWMFMYEKRWARLLAKAAKG